MVKDNVSFYFCSLSLLLKVPCQKVSDFCEIDFLKYDFKSHFIEKKNIHKIIQT